MVWRDVLKASVVPALVAALVVWVVIRSLQREEKAGVATLREYFASATDLLYNRTLVVLVVATALRGIGESAVGAYLPLYLREDLEISAIGVALFISGSQVAGIVSQPVMGYLSDKYGRKPVLVPATLALALLALALSVAKPGPQVLAIVLAKGAFTFSLHHIYIAAALDATHERVQSTVVSLIYGAAFLGTFSPSVAGLISDTYGIHSAFIYGGAVLLLPALLLLTVDMRRPEDAASG